MGRVAEEWGVKVGGKSVGKCEGQELGESRNDEEGKLG